MNDNKSVLLLPYEMELITCYRDQIMEKHGLLNRNKSIIYFEPKEGTNYLDTFFFVSSTPSSSCSRISTPFIAVVGFSRRKTFLLAAGGDGGVTRVTSVTQHVM